MCGIAAVFGQRIGDGEAILLDSLSRIAHRGTDLYEIRSFPRAAIGANRLPITGREEGQQPLANEDDTVFAVQNGEIFNHKELRKTLEAKGHSFKTGCDTEVLVHLYEEYGEDMTAHLDSEMFAFVVYDAGRGRMFAARDRFGLKPLYYATDAAGNLHLASELKQLTAREDIASVRAFPPGHVMTADGTLKRYYAPRAGNKVRDPDIARCTLTRLIVEAVRKRVDTDLPVAVLLSGGVDSSLIMEIANRLHPDVTAFILGVPGSPDHEAALRLCHEYGYAYRVVTPDVDYGAEMDDVIRHLETFEAQIIRQSFALDVLSKAVVREGFRIALVGDASDELFAGYNEFVSLPPDAVNDACLRLTTDLARGHNLRLDRMSMRHTLELRAPLFDTAVADYALQIHGKLKIRREGHRVTTKHILRRVAADFLPDHIAWRYKVPFSNGAGMNVGYSFRSEDGEVAKAAAAAYVRDADPEAVERYSLETDEERAYYARYDALGYAKLEDDGDRILTKDTLRDVDPNAAGRLLVAEFDKLPLYYPLYHAASQGFFRAHGVDVEFISTGGDEQTYQSLLNGSAQIGVADPVFSYAENPQGVKGRIIGELIGTMPVRAVALRPDVRVSQLKDLADYRIGTFKKFTTTHTILRHLLPDAEIETFDHGELLGALQNRFIDVAVCIPEQAQEVLSRGGHLVHAFEEDLPRFLFTGFSVSDTLDPMYKDALRSFLSAVTEALRDIRNHPENALKAFAAEFPDVTDPAATLDVLRPLWSKSLKLQDADAGKAKHVWHATYPWLLKANGPRFLEPQPEDELAKILASRQFSRDIPYREDAMRRILREVLLAHRPLPMVTFWGAGAKGAMDDADRGALAQLEAMLKAIKKKHAQGAALTVLLSDEHARLNGFDPASYLPYLAEVRAALEAMGAACVSVKDAWDAWGMTAEQIFSELRLRNRKHPGWWKDVPFRASLEDAAAGLGHENPTASAQRYHIMRTMESTHLTASFPDHVFLTYSSDEAQRILPDLPTLYVWVTKGTSHVPWFRS